MHKLLRPTLSALEPVSVRPGSTERNVQEYVEVSTGLGKPKMAKKQVVSLALPEKRIAGVGSVDQRGMISLVICMILMIIISLMTLSFATLSRREQRQALDKQLSTQAFYAAETGINDALKAISDNPLLDDVTDCSDSEQGTINPSGVPDAEAGTLNAGLNVSRTCVLVDQTPSQIDDIVGESTASVFPITVPSLASLDFYWENDSAVSTPDYPATVATDGAFPKDSDWSVNRPGVLTIQLIPFPASGTNRTAIANGMVVVYGYPTASNSNQSVNIGTSGTKGSILTGFCDIDNTNTPNNWPRQCKVSLTGLSDNYYVVLKSTYDPVHLTIEAKNAVGARLSFSGVQVLIDSTGRANDVTKRVKVYKPLRASASLPSSVLEIGDDLCKRLLSNGDGTTTDSAIPSCDPNTL